MQKILFAEKLFRDYLITTGVSDDCIIDLALDLMSDIRYRNPLGLAKFVRMKAEGKCERFYLFVDEIQMSDEVVNPYNPDGRKITFYDALNDLEILSNLDIYVTGSNSKMLSFDILTEFCGRSDEIRVHPLNFAEYYSAVGGDKEEDFDDYAFYGGMPLFLSRPNEAAKMNYLQSLVSEVYLKDIVERKKIKIEDVLCWRPLLIYFVPLSVLLLIRRKLLMRSIQSKSGQAKILWHAIRLRHILIICWMRSCSANVSGGM